MIFVTADVWPDGKHYTARITGTKPVLDDAIDQMTCVPRNPRRWGIFPRRTWGRVGIRFLVEDLARCAAPIPDEERVSIHLVWHPSDPHPLA